MFKSIKILLIVCCTSCLLSCSKNNLHKDIERLMFTKLNINLDSMTYLGNSKSIANLKTAQFTYIVYIDSTHCTECSLKNLNEWSSILNESNMKYKHKLSLIVIVESSNWKKENVKKYIKEDCPMRDFVYLDDKYNFREKNKDALKNPFLNEFMVDRHGKICLIGNPSRNSKLKALMLNTFEKH